MLFTNFSVWASSAPVVYFRGGGPGLGDFDKIATRTLTQSGCNASVIINAFKELEKYKTTNLDSKILLRELIQKGLTFR